MAILRLIDLFPVGGIEPADRSEFNRLVDMEYDRIRDFLILHYHATTRDDSPFWDHVRTMTVPDSLAEKLELWRHTARITRRGEGLFTEQSWVAVYLGQNVIPERWDARAAIPEAGVLDRALAQLEREIAGTVAAMPGHRDYLHRQAERLADAG